MICRAFEQIRGLVSLKAQTDKNTEDIKAIQVQIKDLILQVKELSWEVRAMRDHQAQENENQLLRLKLALSEIENRLPPADPDRGKRLE